MWGQLQSDQHQRAELFAREPGLLTRRQTSEVARSARNPLRCPQRLVIRCVKATMDPLSHVRIDWLRRTQLRHLKSAPPCLRLPHTGLWMVVPPIPGEIACILVVLGHAPGAGDNLMALRRPNPPSRKSRHLSNHTSGHRHCQNLSETRPQTGVVVLGEL